MDYRAMKSLETDTQAVAIGSLTGLAATSIGYAMFLNTRNGRRWDVQHTWFMTVIGVAYTLAWMALVDHKAAMRALLYFAVAGCPIVVRALYNHVQETEAIRKGW